MGDIHLSADVIYAVFTLELLEPGEGSVRVKTKNGTYLIACVA
jgi:hypothetical protein